MDYISWNQIIGNYYFNQSKAGTLVNLHISKAKIIKLGIGQGMANNNDVVWSDFMSALRFGFGQNENETDLIRALDFTKRFYTIQVNTRRIPDSTVPYYFLYLAAVIASLNEPQEGNHSHYDQINRFFTHGGRIICRLEAQNANSNWNIYWDELSNWSKKHSFGCFVVPQMRNQGWVYIIKPLSQLLVSPKVDSRIFGFFYSFGWKPGQPLNDWDWNSFINQHLDKLKMGSRVNFDNLTENDRIDILRPYLESKFKSYSIEDQQRQSQKKNRIRCSLFLGFNREEEKFHFRVFTMNPDLQPIIKDDLRVEKVRHNSSYSDIIEPDSILFDGKNFDNDFTIQTDTHVISYKKKDLFLLVPGSNLALSSSRWLEDKFPLRNNDFILLFGEDRRKELVDKLNLNEERLKRIEENRLALSNYVKLSFHEVVLLSEELNFKKLHNRVKLKGGWSLGRYRYLLNSPPRIVADNQNDIPVVLINNELVEIPGDQKNGFIISKKIKQGILRTKPPLAYIFLEERLQFSLKFERLNNLSMVIPDNQKSEYSSYSQDTDVLINIPPYKNSLQSLKIRNNIFNYGGNNLHENQFITKHNSSYWGKCLIYESSQTGDIRRKHEKLKTFGSYYHNLFLTGHAYFSEGGCILENPYAYEISGYDRPGRRTAVLRGRRDVGFLRRIWELSREMKIVLRLEEPYLQLDNGNRTIFAPPDILFIYEDQKCFEQFCNQCSIRFNPQLHLPSAIVLKERSLEDFKANLSPAITNLNNHQGVQYYNFPTDQYSNVSDNTDTLQLIRLKRNNLTHYYIIDNYDFLFADDFKDEFETWALLYIASQHNRHDIFKYNHDRKTLHVSNEKFLLKNFRKSLIMNGGTIIDYYRSFFLNRPSIEFQNADYHSMRHTLKEKFNQII